MKRWHVLCPDAAHAKALYDDLILADIDCGQIHIFAQDHAALKAAKLPEPTEMEEMMVAGRGIGPFVSAMMGTAPPDPKIKDFIDELEQGRVLLVVILPEGRINQFNALVRKHTDSWSPEVDGIRKSA